MRVPTSPHVYCFVRVAAWVVALVLPAAPGFTAGPRSPLTVPVVSLLDVAPNEHSQIVSVVRGSVVAAEDWASTVGGVHLPDGAIVRALRAFAIDENGDEALEVRLFRRRIGTALLDGVELAAVFSSGSSMSMQVVQDSSVDLPTIDNSLYIYWVSARFFDDIELFGIQVDYLAPLFVDGFESEDTSAWVPGAEEQGFESPLAVHFADAMSTTVGTDGCWSGGSTGSTAEGYIEGGSIDFAECCFVAPVHLPQGVEVTAIVSYLVDSGDANLTLSLRRKSVANQVVTTALATTVSSGSGASVRLFSDGTIDNAVIDNATYTYFLSSDTCLDADHELRFYQTLIFYEE